MIMETVKESASMNGQWKAFKTRHGGKGSRDSFFYQHFWIFLSFAALEHSISGYYLRRDLCVSRSTRHYHSVRVFFTFMTAVASSHGAETLVRVVPVTVEDASTMVMEMLRISEAYSTLQRFSRHILDIGRWIT